MGYGNENQALATSHTLLGEISIPRLALEHDSIRYNGPYNKLYYNGSKISPTELPKIHEGESAFMVRVMSIGDRGSADDGFIAIVDKLRTYKLTGPIVELEFTYHAVRTEYDSSLFALKPAVTRILVDGDFIGIMVEGDETVVKSWANKNLRIFTHGNLIYHNQVIQDITETLDSRKMFGGLLVVAATKKVPDQDGLNRFLARFLRHCRIEFT